MSVNYMIGCSKCECYTNISVVSAGTPKMWTDGEHTVAQFISDHDHPETYGKPNSLVIFNEHDDRYSWRNIDPHAYD